MVNYLVVISFIITIGSFFNPILKDFAMDNYYFFEGKYIELILQFLFYSFLHANFGHLFFNMIFLFLFGNKVEKTIGKNNFLLFFIFTLIFNAIAIMMFSEGSTLGISYFNNAIIGFWIMYLYDKKDPEYKGGITALVVSVISGIIFPEVSFVGHLFGGILGIIYYFIYKKFLLKK